MKPRYKLSIIKNGKRKYTLLYRRWKDIRNRTQGRSTKSPDLYLGLEIGWASFAEFRAFALANGFSKQNSSPDRQRVGEGYTPNNVEFVSPTYNSLRAIHGDDIRGEEPPDAEHVLGCPCKNCTDDMVAA